MLDLQIHEKQSILENFKLGDRTTQIINFAKALLKDSQLSQEISEKMNSDIKKRISNRNIDIGRHSFEGPRQRDEISKLEARLKSLKLPEETKIYLEDELAKLKSMPQSHPENSMIRKYLETALFLPWDTSSTDIYDLEKSKIQLDNDHYGLEKVKKRIIEYIAVRGLKNDMKGSILCFSGPPGVGKTSLGKSIAQAIGRKFFRISLGGVRDESEIRGHRRTYIGSLPGVFIKVSFI